MSGFAIGRLTVLAELGAGAGSRVFHVRRRADGAEYALKVVPAGARADPRYSEQLRNEFRVGPLLDHPNLTKVYALEVRRDWLFRPKAVRLLVEFAPGRALDRLPPLPLGRAVRAFERVASALEHMHARGVLHADVKPGNLIYDPGGRVKLIDFGLAWVEGEPKVRVRGTPPYIAPETVSHGVVTARTDLYNFGATLYHIVARRPPAAAESKTLPGARVRPAAVVPVADLNPHAPAELCDLIDRCMSPDPERRPAGAAEVRAILARLARAGGG
jgi:serine/threonine protein kinase